MNGLKLIGGEFCIPADALQRKKQNSMEPVYSLGRTCFYAILHALKGKIDGLLLPDYLCSSVAEVPVRIGISFQHYHIAPLLVPDFDSIRQAIRGCKGKLGIVLISYFGLVELNETIVAIRAEYPDIVIIVDDVQNYYGFGRYVDFDYCFTSYRKWFAVPDGADLIQKDEAKKPDAFLRCPDYAEYKAAGNLLKNHTEMIGDSVALEMLDRGETMMDREYRCRCSDISRALIQRIDLESLSARRMKNAGILHEGLKRMNIPHLYDPDRTPLFIPLFIPDRDRVRKALFAEKIFAPVHWPVKDSGLQGRNELYNTELSLICDQRYDEEDMERILRGIETAV